MYEVSLMLHEMQANTFKKQSKMCTLCLDKTLRSSLQPVMKIEQKVDRKKKKKEKEEYVSK